MSNRKNRIWIRNPTCLNRPGNPTELVLPIKTGLPPCPLRPDTLTVLHSRSASDLKLAGPFHPGLDRYPPAQYGAYPYAGCSPTPTFNINITINGSQQGVRHADHHHERSGPTYNYDTTANGGNIVNGTLNGAQHRHRVPRAPKTVQSGLTPGDRLPPPASTLPSPPLSPSDHPPFGSPWVQNDQERSLPTVPQGVRQQSPTFPDPDSGPHQHRPLQHISWSTKHEERLGSKERSRNLWRDPVLQRFPPPAFNPWATQGQLSPTTFSPSQHATVAVERSNNVNREPSGQLIQKDTPPGNPSAHETEGGNTKPGKENRGRREDHTHPSPELSTSESSTHRPWLQHRSLKPLAPRDVYEQMGVLWDEQSGQFRESEAVLRVTPKRNDISYSDPDESEGLTDLDSDDGRVLGSRGEERGKKVKPRQQPSRRWEGNPLLKEGNATSIMRSKNAPPLPPSNFKPEGGDGQRAVDIGDCPRSTAALSAGSVNLLHYRIQGETASVLHTSPTRSSPNTRLGPSGLNELGHADIDNRANSDDFLGTTNGDGKRKRKSLENGWARKIFRRAPPN